MIVDLSSLQRARLSLGEDLTGLTVPKFDFTFKSEPFVSERLRREVVGRNEYGTSHDCGVD